ncbi:MAG: hypothetical protein KDB22_01875 [Planctomycetales bacterium]|nr:hypothetical protein [Planctomycetales bacterium]
MDATRTSEALPAQRHELNFAGKPPVGGNSVLTVAGIFRLFSGSTTGSGIDAPEIEEMNNMRMLILGLFCVTATLAVPNLCPAQTPGDSLLGNSGQLSLGAQQKSVAERFTTLEELLLRSAEIVESENPTRAALLKQAVQLSKQAKLAGALVEAAQNLDNGQYVEAIEQQKISRDNLQRILDLLQSENREQRIREQRDQVRRWIEETDRLLRMQSSLRGRTEGGQEFKPAAENQLQLEDKAKDIQSDLNGGEEVKDDADSNSQPASETKEQQDSSEQNEDSSKSPDSPASDAPASGEADADPAATDQSSENDQRSPGAPGDPSPGSPSPGDVSQPVDSSPQPQQPQSPSDRAQQKIAEARQRMEEARQALEAAERDQAVAKQRQAEESLRDAVAELQQILRQLREEEIERSLASLEVRLRRMLDAQAKVLNETQRLAEIGGDNDERQVQMLSNKLSLEERKILADGERAFLLLREEGSSSAFPEAMQQVNSDIENVAERLAKGDVGELTLIFEEEIVVALEEMVQSLVQVQKENADKKSQQQNNDGQGQQQQGDQPLVDKLAELRLVRTLQTRINKRTATLSKILETGSQPETILPDLLELASRQQKLVGVAQTLQASQ